MRGDLARRLLAIVDLATIDGAGSSVEASVERALAAGVRVFLLRGKGARAGLLDSVDLRSLAASIRREGGVFLLHGDSAWPVDLSLADGVHRGAGVLWERAPRVVERSRWGVSCHSREELARAASLGASWVTLSPFAETSSKPGYGPPLGVEGLRKLLDGCTVPAFALAGVQASTARGIAASGVAGVALMGMIASRDFESRFRALVHVMEGELWKVHPPW